jgi:hypothetical protein
MAKKKSTVKKQKSPPKKRPSKTPPAGKLNKKKPSKRSLAAKKAALQKKALFKKRSLAAKKGWVTRRKLSISRENKHHLLSKIKQLEEKLRTAEGYTDQFIKRYQHEIAMDNLPPRMIHETATEHAGRIIKALKLRGYNADQSYSAVAQHTGMNPREVYTLFLYVGPGEYVAWGTACQRKMVQITLSPEELAKLDAMAKQRGETRSACVAGMVARARVRWWERAAAANRAHAAD